MLRTFVMNAGLVCAMASASLAAQGAQLDADTKEVLAYNLTIPALQKIVVATRNMMTAMKNDPRYGRLMKLEAEKKALEKQLEDKAEPTEADYARLEKLEAEIDALENSSSKSLSNAKTLSEMEANINREPLMAAALKSAGLSAREYSKFMLAFFQAGMIHGMQKSGMAKDIPKELQATVNMANVKFIAANEAEIEKLMGELKAMGKTE